MIQIKTVARRRPHGTGPSLCGVAWVPAAFPGPAAPVASASAQLAPRLQRGGRELSSLGPARGADGVGTECSGRLRCSRSVGG